MTNFGKIIVFDLNSELYLKYKTKFCQTFVIQENKIEYINAFIDSTLISSINYKKNDLITFVHFLEHFHLDDFQSMLDAVPNDIAILIYEPNADTCRDKNWWHFDEQHVVLTSDKTLVKYFKNRYKAEILIQETCSDDFFLLFKKHTDK